ncbi:MAG: hypothetical protein A3C84_02700 [Candidatus Ryanbacteria bacterium RIFCSPHIGHO2_02_FULL_48_12]|jgi:hypothetical protein|uniref:DUF304 domain-containing protein n=1 Tax=Candidatus Ryanbacteria bacterium RIFCSPHIGHO2_01_FULL_48_27 TaxID=1802115 RepID=A0A1G2G4V4_9BACT|nr:MAG: hypothetical protein A2756_01175 [Candidatus Ryanbacteria bacterium RIFCSPHIGHO2_01_FULL_48_27]OGZ49015.1 MAG: hypothetical protein A3C84_02700 [Candidatus Ryanbacteria bacterium RIFCSPHIGHO2_02_FULL_48_12]
MVGMDKNVKVYRANKFYSLPILLVPLLLLIPLFEAGMPIESGRLVGYGILSLLATVLAVIPFGARLEIGEDYIKTYLFGLTTTPKIHASDIQVLEYGNLFRGGLGYGKGINFRALRGGKSKAYSIGESIYGKEAIAHAKRVLESQLPKTGTERI